MKRRKKGNEEKTKMELKKGNLAKIHHNWECIQAIVVLCL